MPSTVSGKRFENFVQGVIQSKGFPVVHYRDFSQNAQLSNVLVTNFPYQCVFDFESETEFVLVKNNRRIRIECKMQLTKGTKDTALHTAYYDAINMPEEEVLIIIDGNGVRPKILEWLQNAIDQKLHIPENKKKTIKKVNILEFSKWVEKDFPHLSTI